MCYFQSYTRCICTFKLFRRAATRLYFLGQEIGRSTWGFSQGNREQFDQGVMLGSAAGLISGLGSAENTCIVQIPQSSVYVLSLEAPIQLSVR